MGLIFRQISRFEDFQDLREEWNRLVKTTDVDHAFMRHEWFECWIKHLKPKSKIVIHTARENNRLVAIAPLQIIKQVRKRIPLRLLTFLRSSITPRSNFIIDDSIDSNLFFDSIFASDGWDVAEFRTVEVGIPITNKLLNYLKHNKKYVIEDSLQSPYEIINTDWETYLKTRSDNYRADYRKCFNRLKKNGNGKILCINTYNEFEKYFDSLIRVSSRSWKVKGGTDLKSMPQFANFYKNFTYVGCNDKLFILYLLVVDNKVTAFNYYLMHNNRVVGIRSDYDNDFKYLMPGTLLHFKCLKDIIDTKEKWEYDLAGRASAYKLKLAKDIRKHIDITVGKPGFYGNFIMCLKKKLMRSNDITDDFIK